MPADKKGSKDSRRLKSALRDNLKKRKAQARKLSGEAERDTAAMQLRNRELSKKRD